VLRIVRVLAPNPGPFTLDGTNTWIVGEGPTMVIDPGPDDTSHLDAVVAEARDVAAVLITHDHPDHAQGAAALAGRVGAPVRAFRAAEGWRAIADGEELDVGGARLRAVHTPGHAPDHVAFVSDEALFTGDAVLGRGTSVIDPPEGDLAAYLRSLDRMLRLNARVIYPGHGPVVFDAAGKLREYIAHRAMREEQVVGALARGPARPADLVGEIYADVPAELHPVAERQVLAHLLKLEKEGRAVRVGIGKAERFAVPDVRGCDRCGRPVPPGRRLCTRCALDALQETPGR
jgi:glyoxylase-like metal-dependent hydrolase (beta-lactamase superfamily II)